MVDRIKKLIAQQKLSATQFANEIGVQRSALSHLLSGRNKASLDFMLKIKTRYPEVNFDWLLLGTGKMFVQKQNEELPVQTEQHDLFADETPSGDDLLASTQQKEDEQGAAFNLAKAEDIPTYGKGPAKQGAQPEKVILLYADQTFKVFDSR